MTHRQRGFSLIELGIVLLIMGIIAGILGPAIFKGVKQEQVSTGRDNLRELRDRIIGYAIDTCDGLPPDIATVNQELDDWGREYRYVYDPDYEDGPAGTKNICADTDAALTVATPDGTVGDVVFIVASDGPDFQPNIDLTADPLDLTDPGDDLVLYVTLGHLKGVVCAGLHCRADDAPPAPPAGAISQWAMEEGAGTSLTDTGSAGNTAAFTPPDGARWVEAGDGYGLNFDNEDGVNAYLTVDWDAVYDLTEFSISGWFRTAYAGQFGVITSKERTWSDRNWWVTVWTENGFNQRNWDCSQTYQGGELAFRVSTRGYSPACGGDGFKQGVNIATPAPVTDNKWHWFVAQANASLARLFLDGQLMAWQEDAGEPETPRADIYIGKGGSWSDNEVRNFNGTIDDIIIYGRMLDPEEIAAYYDDAKGYY